jgi:hypothetical protein
MVVVLASVGAAVDCAAPPPADATVVAGEVSSVAVVAGSSARSPPLAATPRTPRVTAKVAIGAARRAHCGQPR